MATTVELVEGWTGNVDMRLKADGVAQNLTGSVVTLILRDRNGVEVDTTGDVSVPDAVNGIVRYGPDSVDLTNVGSPYSARWRVVDGSSKVTFFPSSVDPDAWKVGKA